MPDTPNTERHYLTLGSYFDQLLNVECKLFDHDEVLQYGGIIRPTASSAGTGNIIIRGKAGTGKTTLGLQIAVEAARRNDGIHTAYISLEENITHIFEKAKKFKWGRYIKPLNRLPPPPAEYQTSDDDLAKDLREILGMPMMCRATGSSIDESKYGNSDDCAQTDCPYKEYCAFFEEHQDDPPEYTGCPGCVILPRLEPRVFTNAAKNDNDELFWQRYKQLDDLLRAAQEMRKSSSSKGKDGQDGSQEDLAIVCIDSLNVLGSAGLTRDHLAALFDLFKRRRTIGVFIVEENENKTFAGDNPIDSDTIDFLADMVIELNTREENGYFVRHFEVIKSRYQRSVYGRHPFKTEENKHVDDFDISRVIVDIRQLQSIKSLTENTQPSFKDGVTNFKRELLTPAQETLKKYPESLKTSFGKWLAIFEKDLLNLAQETLKKYPESLKTSFDEWSASFEKDLLKQTMAKIDQLFEQHRRRESGMGIRLYPSLHYVARESDRFVSSNNASNNDETPFGSVNDFNTKILGQKLSNKNEVVAIIGPEATGKSLLAGNFLLQGLAEGDALLISLDERTAIDFRTWQMVENGKHKDSKLSENTQFVTESSDNDDVSNVSGINELKKILKSENMRFAFTLREIKSETIHRDDEPHQSAPASILIELKFMPGAILPEMFVKVIRMIYLWGERYRGGKTIRRAALLQADAIGVSYPVLYKSSTASDLFLTTLAHIFRCKGTYFTITAQTGGVPQSEEMVSKARSLATRIITTKYQDVFGDRYITVSGSGRGTEEWQAEGASSAAPAVLRQSRDRTKFWTDFDMLNGLVGFSTDRIRRPGVMLQLFQEGLLHAKYNNHVKRLVEFALGTKKNPDTYDENEPVVELNGFDSTTSGSFHDSLDVLHKTPLHNTVIRTVDEFGSTGDESENDDVPKRKEPLSYFEFPEDVQKILENEELSVLKRKLIESNTYYKNVLLFACDATTYKEIKGGTEYNFTEVIKFWEKVEKLQHKTSILYDSRAPETLSCLLMDGVVSLLFQGKQISKEQNLGTKLNEINGIEPEKLLAKYIAALRNIFCDSNPILQSDFPNDGDHDFTEKEEKTILSKHLLDELAKGENGGRYFIIAWYSHIRELIEHALHHNENYIEKTCLSKKNESDKNESDIEKAIKNNLSTMCLGSLPGRGFVGDWFLEIPNTSVSKSLGETIKTKLLAPQEGFRRFIEGVGLPCWSSDGQSSSKDKKEKYFSIFYDKLFPNEGNGAAAAKLEEPYASLHTQLLNDATSLKKIKDALTKLVENEKYRKSRETVMAWPGASTMKLKTVLEIHTKANHRSKIEKYDELRREFSAIMEHIICGEVKSTGMSANPGKDENENAKPNDDPTPGDIQISELIVKLIKSTAQTSKNNK